MSGIGWEVSGVNPDGFYVIRDGMGRKVATAFGKEDADKVAASGDMLKALELAATYFGPARHGPPECAEDECARAIQNAMRKAKGETT